MVPFIEQAYRSRGIKTVLEGGGVHLNDVPSIAYAVQPDLFECQALFVEIETRGAFTAGQTVADFDRVWGKPPNVQVCLGVNALGVADLFTDSLAQYRPGAMQALP